MHARDDDSGAVSYEISERALDLARGRRIVEAQIGRYVQWPVAWSVRVLGMGRHRGGVTCHRIRELVVGVDLVQTPNRPVEPLAECLRVVLKSILTRNLSQQAYDFLGCPGEVPSDIWIPSKLLFKPGLVFPVKPGGYTRSQ